MVQYEQSVNTETKSLRRSQGNCEGWQTYGLSLIVLTAMACIVYWGNGVARENKHLKSIIARGDSERLIQREQRIQAARNLDRS